VAVFGPQGSGKTQCVILPAIADRMRDGHSLIVTDVQGELQPYIEKIASVTGHLLVVHNPSEPAGSCAINLNDWVDNVADARSMAAVLLSEAHGRGDPFWARAAVNLLAACALHYPTFGQVLEARQRLHEMAKELAASQVPGAADLAADFTGSMRTQEPKLALNIMAEAFNVGLAPWADPTVREITSHTDLDLAAQLARVPTVLILRCARRHEEAYGPYLGTVLRVLTTRLDDIGESQSNGQLPIPVGLILEEFPALGRLDSLVRDINLVRKRRISVLTAAQSLAQFDHVYPARGEADRLLAGLATKIVLGGCDQRTAEFFSGVSGQRTLAMTSLSQSRRQGGKAHDGATASLRGRPLLLPDDLIRPDKGHATVFAAYSEGGRAEQAIFHADLVPFFKQRNWNLEKVQPKVPLRVSKPVLERKPKPMNEVKPDLVSGW
jgi:type IV secretion system protein VirD4